MRNLSIGRAFNKYLPFSRGRQHMFNARPMLLTSYPVAGAHTRARFPAAHGWRLL
jgi:hypothetical protein